MFPENVRTPEAITGDYQVNWRKLQQVGLNAYEARSYLVLLGHNRFKALEVAARAHVPRQKIYEVLDSLIDKGFAHVLQEKTKLFSAIDPTLALPGYVARRARVLQHEINEQSRVATGLIDDLREAYQEGRGVDGTIDFLSLVNDPAQIAVHYRRMLARVESHYEEFSRAPFAVDPFEERLVLDKVAGGVRCRLLIEENEIDEEHRNRLETYRCSGVQIRACSRLPLKLALFDGRSGLLALLDPAPARLALTAVIFEHAAFTEAMAGLFESYWTRARELQPAAVLEPEIRTVG